MSKNTLTTYIKIILIGIIMPIVAYFLLRIFNQLDNQLFATASLTGFYTICILIFVKSIMKKNYLTSLISIILFPLVAYFLINSIISLDANIFASIGFSAVFAVCIELVFELLSK